MAVTRPANLVIVDVEIEFNFLIYTKLEIDVNHINYGKSFTRVVNYSANEVAGLVHLLLDGVSSDLYTEKVYGDESCYYFSLIKNIDERRYKIVFCTCSDRQGVLGIMTLYRVRR